MSDFKKRILEPLLIPLSAFVFVGGVAWGLSRMLLATTADGATFLALIAALSVLATCGIIASKGFHAPQRTATIVSYVALVAGGSIFAATAGIRPVEHHLPEASFTITAGNAQSFDQNHIHLEEKEEQVVRFINKDPAAPHNWGVTRTREFSTDPGRLLVVPGSPLNKGESRDYLLEESKIPAGTYFYFCFVHPVMTGQLDIGEGGEGPPPPPPPPTRRPSIPPPPSSGPPVPGLTVSIKAQNIQFDSPTIRLPAGKRVEILFENADNQIPHNLSIYRDEAYTENIFEGEIFPGPAAKSYSFEAPPAGTYFFRCDVHPAMKGRAIFA